MSFPHVRSRAVPVGGLTGWTVATPLWQPRTFVKVVKEHEVRRSVGEMVQAGLPVVQLPSGVLEDMAQCSGDVVAFLASVPVVMARVTALPMAEGKAKFPQKPRLQQV